MSMGPFNRFVRNLLLHQRAAREGGMDRRQFLRACVVGGAALPFISPIEVLGRVTAQPWPVGYRMRIFQELATGNPAAIDAFVAYISPVVVRVIERTLVIQ